MLNIFECFHMSVHLCEGSVLILAAPSNLRAINSMTMYNIILPLCQNTKLVRKSDITVSSINVSLFIICDENSK